MSAVEPAQPTVPAEKRRGFRAVALHCVQNYGASAGLLVSILVLWQIIVRVRDVPKYLLPAPSDILVALHDDWDILEHGTMVTVREILLGFLLALVGAVTIAIALHLSATLRRAVYPLLIASQAMPTLVLGPILVVIMGYNMYPKLIIVAMVCFFPIVVNTVEGLGSLDPALIRMMRTLDGSRLAIFRRAELPASLPMMFTGIRIAVIYAPIGAVVAEWSGSSEGLGFLMLEATPNLLLARIFAVIVILTLMSVSLFAFVFVFERVTIPWATVSKRA